YHPFALNSRRDKFAPAEYLCDIRTAAQQGAGVGTRNFRHARGAHRGERMVGARDRKQIQIAKLPWHVDGENLAAPIGKLLVFLYPARQDDMKHARMLTLAHHIFAFAIIARISRKTRLP